MDNVEIVLIFCLHITLWVSHTLTNCTHHKQIFVKLCTCDCVSNYVAFEKINFLICLMHFGSEEWKDWRNLLKFDFFFFCLEKFGFVKHLNSWTYISYHKNSFSNVSIENVFQIFKIFVSSGFDRSSLFFNRSKREEENSVFQLKVSGLLDSFLIPFD